MTIFTNSPVMVIRLGASHSGSCWTTQFHQFCMNGSKMLALWQLYLCSFSLFSWLGLNRGPTLKIRSKRENVLVTSPCRFDCILYLWLKNKSTWDQQVILWWGSGTSVELNSCTGFSSSLRTQQKWQRKNSYVCKHEDLPSLYSSYLMTNQTQCQSLVSPFC